MYTGQVLSTENTYKYKMQIQAESSQSGDLTPTQVPSQSNTPEKTEQEVRKENKPPSEEQTLATETQSKEPAGGELVAEQQTAEH